MVKTKKGYKSVFNMKLFKIGNRLDMKPFEPEMEDMDYTMSALWERLKGI